MSKLGFDKVAKRFSLLEREFFPKAIAAARAEFKSNFDNESNAELNTKWQSVKRKVPPKILVETDKLRQETITRGAFRIMKTKKDSATVVLVIDPIDKNGKGYAKYHQDGIGVAERAFVTQSTILTRKQISILERVADSFFL